MRRLAPAATEAFALVLVLLAAACQSAPTPGASCTHTSECASGLVCRYGRCRAECTANADCPLGAACLLGADGSGACGLDADLGCTTSGVGRTCATGLVCVADRCERPCTSAADCPSDGVCLPVGDGTRFCFDARASADAGLPVVDAGTDASVVDAGPPDAATQLDVGPVDAATVDAGLLRTGALDVCAGPRSACLVAADRSVWCWGSSAHGQLGTGGDCTGAATQVASPLAPVAGIAGADAITCGDDFACAHTSDGRVWCWGANDRGQLGRITSVTCDASAGAIPSLTTTDTGAGHGAGATVELRAAGAHACVLDPARDTLVCWGANDGVFDGTSTSSTSATPVDATAPLTAAPAAWTAADGLSTFALGTNAVCVLTDAGAALCWGDDTFGQLGTRTPTAGHAVSVLGFADGVQLSAGDGFFCGVNLVGAAYCWGDCRSGVLSADVASLVCDLDCGPGAADPCTTSPQPVATTSVRFSDVASAGHTTCGVITMREGSGRALCWGADESLQAGDPSGGPLTFGDEMATGYPLVSDGPVMLDRFDHVAMGATTACVIDARGVLACWGDADLDPATAPSAVPLVVPLPF